MRVGSNLKRNEVATNSYWRRESNDRRWRSCFQRSHRESTWTLNDPLTRSPQFCFQVALAKHVILVISGLQWDKIIAIRKRNTKTIKLSYDLRRKKSHHILQVATIFQLLWYSKTVLKGFDRKYKDYCNKHLPAYQKALETSKKKRKVLTKYLPMIDRNASRKEREIEAGIRRFLRKLGKRIERAGSRSSL
jgi:hypothetical protein